MGRLEVQSHLGPGDERTLADDVLDGLTRPFKELPAKHLYDARGSELFELICELPEYYPTRTERAILEARAADIVARVRPRDLVELGSGAADKTRVLLDAMRDAGVLERYVPVDVSETAVRASARALAADYPGLEVLGVIGDFERHLDHLPEGGRRLVAFLGGTIGNFPPGSRRRLLRRLRDGLDPGDRLLLGTDLVKDPERIRRAYDDAQGITAAFNRNVLAVLNRDLGADFELGNFEHVALYDAQNEWIEMRLRAREAATVRIPGVGLEIAVQAGEEIRTEISAKFTRARLEADYAVAGLVLEAFYTDPEDLFALSLACRADDGPRLD